MTAMRTGGTGPRCHTLITPRPRAISPRTPLDLSGPAAVGAWAGRSAHLRRGRAAQSGHTGAGRTANAWLGAVRGGMTCGLVRRRAGSYRARMPCTEPTDTPTRLAMARIEWPWSRRARAFLTTPADSGRRPRRLANQAIQAHGRCQPFLHQYARGAGCKPVPPLTLRSPQAK